MTDRIFLSLTEEETGTLERLLERVNLFGTNGLIAETSSVRKLIKNGGNHCGKCVWFGYLDDNPVCRSDYFTISTFGGTVTPIPSMQFCCAGFEAKDG